MKLRTVLATAGIAALSAVPFAFSAQAATGPNTGSCAKSGYTPSGAVTPLGGGASLDQTGDPTTGAGSATVFGDHGHLTLAGDANDQTGGLSGYQTESGVNGYAGSNGVCAGVDGTGGAQVDHP